MSSSVAAATTTKVISKCMVKPLHISEESQKPCYLTPWDIQSLTYEYMQFGLVFAQPHHPIELSLLRIKRSLSVALTYFFPLSGRFVTKDIQNPPSHVVFVDCKDPPGAEFVHAVSNITISDLLTSTDVPVITESLFALDPGTLNHQAHTEPLLVVQVTQLIDGVFIGLSMNHALADGTSFWQFVNSWSEICRSTQELQKNYVISRPPVTRRWFLDNQDYIPTPHLSNASVISELPILPREAYRQRVFNFTSQALSQLKARANTESQSDNVSSYQSLAALLWRSTTRARGLQGDQMTTCAVPVDSRPRLKPPLSKDYFGSAFIVESVSCTVNELLSNSLGWTALKVHNQIANHTDNKVRSFLEDFIPSDCPVEVPALLYLGSSPWFDVYGNDFGWGSPTGLRWHGDNIDGYAHILPGHSISYAHVFPGRSNGSVELMVCLCSKFMNALELDDEFMGALSPSCTPIPDV